MVFDGGSISYDESDEIHNHGDFNVMHYTSYDSDTLRHLQSVLSMILKDFDKICMDNGINYSVDGGTALGAIRHQGIIPWDDDVDVIMLREEYEKFREIIKDSEKYELLNIEDYPDYLFNHCKLSLRGTKFQLPWNRKTDFTLGINIDIFILDDVPDDDSKMKKYLNTRKKMSTIIYLYSLEKNEIYNSNLKKIITKSLYFILNSLRVNPDYLKRKYKKLIAENSNNNYNSVFHDGWRALHNHPLPKEWFSSFERVEFGDFEVNIIKEYDNYLKTVYGDYMKVPPEESRMVVAPDLIDFGKY